METAATQIGTVFIYGKWGLSLLVLLAAPAWGFDANGVALGASEEQVLEHFPAARCKPMEWKTRAADRRCDDAPVLVGGAQMRVSFFLKSNAVQAFDLRFEARDLERAAAYLKSRYGAPDAEGRETVVRGGKAREIYKLRWRRGADRAVLTAPAGQRRVDLNVWRGNFDTEVYRIR